MHAVLINVTVSDRETAEASLHSEVVPRVSQAPGFVAGYWTRSQGDKGTALIVFESEDSAEAAKGQIEQQGPPTDAVAFDSIEVREVIAHA